MPNSPRKNQNEYIKQTTHNQSKVGRTSSFSRPSSATQKVRDYFCLHQNRQNQEDTDNEPLVTRLVTRWPSQTSNTIRKEDEQVLGKNLDMILSLTQKQKYQKQKRREQRAAATEAARLTGRYLTLEEEKAKDTAEETPKMPKLRHKGNFSEAFMDNLGDILSQQSGGNTTQEKVAEKHKQKFERLRTLRAAMREGRIERVVPPISIISMTNTQSPTPPTPVLAGEAKPFNTTSLKSPAALSQHSLGKFKTSTTLTSGNLSEYIGISADILDSTRREIAKDLVGKFRPPFEHLNYRSSHLSRHTSISSDASSTFFCIGEDQNVDAVNALGNRQENVGRRLSGPGTNPWTERPPEICKLCRKKGVRGIRGLCRKCEADFMHPKAAVFQASSSEVDAIKPTPPLKDKRMLSMKAEGKNGKSALGNEEKKVKPRVSFEQLKLSHADNRPKLVQASRNRPGSHQAIIEGGEGDEIERHRCWQTPSMRAEFERIQSMFEEWPACYREDDFSDYGELEEEEDEGTPLVEASGKGKEKERFATRNSSFYRYWDKILRD